MVKTKELMQIVFFGIWILVGILSLFALSRYLSDSLPNPQNNAAMQAAGQNPQQENQGVNPQQAGQQVSIQPGQQMQQQMPPQQQNLQQSQTQPVQDQKGPVQTTRSGISPYGPQPNASQ